MSEEHVESMPVRGAARRAGIRARCRPPRRPADAPRDHSDRAAEAEWHELRDPAAARCGETPVVVDLSCARLRHAPAVKRLPLPADLLALAQVGVEIGAPPGGPFWRAVEARMEAHVEAELPRGARDWRVTWDPQLFEIVLRWKP